MSIFFFASTHWLTQKLLSSSSHHLFWQSSLKDWVIHLQIAEEKNNKGAFFGLLIIQLVLYIRVPKQLFTSVWVKVVDFYHAFALLSKYPPLFPLQWLLCLCALPFVTYFTVLQSFQSLLILATLRNPASLFYFVSYRQRHFHFWWYWRNPGLRWWANTRLCCTKVHWEPSVAG